MGNDRNCWKLTDLLVICGVRAIKLLEIGRFAGNLQKSWPEVRWAWTKKKVNEVDGAGHYRNIRADIHIYIYIYIYIHVNKYM